MKSRPMIFKPNMVQALLADRPAQRRWLVNPQPPARLLNVSWGQMTDKQKSDWQKEFDEWRSLTDCPHGAVGDRFWVKESWCGGKGHHEFWYKADFIQRYDAWEQDTPDGVLRNEIGWISPELMPCKVSRFNVEITKIDLARVRETKGINSKKLWFWIVKFERVEVQS